MGLGIWYILGNGVCLVFDMISFLKVFLKLYLVGNKFFFLGRGGEKLDF